MQAPCLFEELPRLGLGRRAVSVRFIEVIGVFILIRGNPTLLVLFQQFVNPALGLFGEREAQDEPGRFTGHEPSDYGHSFLSAKSGGIFVRRYDRSSIRP
jgi:hypothetical protein